MQELGLIGGMDSGTPLDDQHLPELVQSVSDGLVEDLRFLMKRLITSVDDQIFLLADTTHSIEEQNCYLALMHLFHINKQKLLDNGVHKICDEFLHNYHADSAALNGKIPGYLDFNWSDNSQQQFELEKLAESLWHKLHKENFDTIHSINEKLNALFSCQLQDVDFPLSALYISHSIAEQFIRICESSSDAILVMHFLRHTGADFSYFYAQQKKRLSLFDSEFTSLTLQHHGANVPVKIKSYRRDSSIDQLTQDLLVGQTPEFDQPLGEALNADMENCLSELQSVYNLPGSKLKEQPLKEVIVDRLGRGLSKNENHALQLVGNLFTRILSEKSLPHVVREQIENLKVPCVKLALDQSRLFSDNSHPMIELIDTIAESVLLMNLRRGEPDAKDPVFLAIQDAVQRVCFGFTHDDTLIADVSASLQYQTSQLVLKNKEKYEKQRDRKLDLISKLKIKLHHQHVPPIVSRFVRDIWYDVLKFNCDNENATFEDMEHLLDDLIWSVQPKHLEQEKKLLLQMIPQLLGKIRQAVSETFISEDKCERFITELENIHIHSLQGRQILGDSLAQEEYDYRQDTIQLEDIEANSWVRFVQNQRAYYLRFDSYNEFSREYSFVDSAYQKVVVLRKEELANCLSLGEMELHADHSLFSRSLRAVM